jgi:glucosamine--fructose-6-phosphate aminotransferase (isomerizing)
VGSLIARSTNCGVYLNAGREHAVASTKAFTTQVAAMALVAGWFAQNRPPLQAGLAAQHNHRREELIEAIHRLPTVSAGGSDQLVRPS